MTKFLSRSFFSASIGTLIEYYDYALFSIFFPIMVPVFIPSDSAYHALMKGYWILALTAMARPFGGLFFGYIGDHFGRRPALLLSLYGISAATLVIGVMPSFEHIGLWGIILITLAKAVQVFCFAGEQNGGPVYALEHLKNHREGLAGSILSAMTWGGSLIAALIGVILTSDHMPAWSWRLAFILGGFMAFLGVMTRKNMEESPELNTHRIEEHRFRDLFIRFPRELLAGVWIGGFVTVPCTTVLIFINPVLMTQGFFSAQELMGVQSLLTVFAIITLLISGQMADQQSSPTQIMKTGALALCLLAYPLLWAVDQKSLSGILLASSLMIVINEWGFGPTHAYLKNLFPMKYRYRACSLSFSVGMSIFGALTPLCEGYLLELTGRFSSIALWLILVGLGMFLSMDWVSRRLDKESP